MFCKIFITQLRNCVMLVTPLKIVIHLDVVRCRTTSSEAIRPNLESILMS